MKTKMDLVKKVLGFVLTLVMVCGMLPMTSNAAEGQTFYVAPNNYWVDSNPRYATYFFNDSSNTWVDMTAVEGTSYYKVTVPAGDWTTMIFCRMNPDNTTNSWDTKWNQTGDLVISDAGTNCLYTVAPDTWDNGGGTWSHVDSASDGVCDLCGAYTDGIGAKLAGYSLSVDGKIGVNFYMELDALVAGNSDAYMQFTLPDGSTPQVKVSEATQAAVAEKTYYVFTCEVAAKEMASAIKAQMVSGENKGTEYTYTVRDYADALIASSSSDTEKAFVKAMLNYGAASQTYFGFNATDLANKNSDSTDVTAYTADDLASFKAVVTDANSILSDAKANLVLESDTTLNVKFTAAEGATVTLNSSSVSATGTNYVIPVENLNATQLDATQNVEVTVSGNTATIACSPLSYCYSVLANSSDANLKNVVCALYDYNKAADAYIVTQ